MNVDPCIEGHVAKRASLNSSSGNNARDKLLTVDGNEHRPPGIAWRGVAFLFGIKCPNDPRVVNNIDGICTHVFFAKGIVWTGGARADAAEANEGHWLAYGWLIHVDVRGSDVGYILRQLQNGNIGKQ